MAVKRIELENFKGKNVSFTIGKQNIISGRNGAGKSSIKDALAFAFCGTDSFGTRNPTHLISKDMDSTRVTVLTDKALLTRTLTRKGNGIIKVEINGISSTYNQGQLEASVGKVDTFLSAMIPGYLFELSEAKRQEVLADVLPKEDRLALLTEMLGFELTPEEKLKYGFHRRPDLVATTVAQDRRSAEATINQKRGRIAQLSELEKPQEPEAVDLSSELSAMVHLKAQWVEYEKFIKDSSARKLKRMQVAQENSFREQRRKEIAEKMEGLKLKPKTEYAPKDVSLLQNMILPIPGMPVLPSEVSSDHCPTCGQAVSLKTKEAVKVRNASVLKAWEEEKERVLATNEKIRDEIRELHQKNEEMKNTYLETIEHNRKVEAMRKSLEIELAGLIDQDLPEEISEQEAPASVYSASAHMALVEKQETYKKALAIYDVRLSDWQTSAKQIELLNKEVEELDKVFERLRSIEKALKELPEVETRKQIGIFNTDKIVFDGNDVFVDGTPRNMLSTGERAKVDIYFCREVGLRMPKPHGLVFIDDADLISEGNWANIVEKSWDASKFQDFLIYVSEDDLKLEIKE